jgi:hypothetical protein
LKVMKGLIPFRVAVLACFSLGALGGEIPAKKVVVRVCGSSGAIRRVDCDPLTTMHDLCAASGCFAVRIDKASVALPPSRTVQSLPRGALLYAEYTAQEKALQEDAKTATNVKSRRPAAGLRVSRLSDFEDAIQVLPSAALNSQCFETLCSFGPRLLVDRPIRRGAWRSFASTRAF